MDDLLELALDILLEGVRGDSCVPEGAAASTDHTDPDSGDRFLWGSWTDLLGGT